MAVAELRSLDRPIRYRGRLTLSGSGSSLSDTHDQSPTALILVSNPATHDSRVLRQAATLRDFGFDVSIVGVVSAGEQRTEARISGFRVIRLTPVETLRRLLRKPRRSSAQGADSDLPQAATRTARSKAPRFAALRRHAIASVYFLQGVAIVQRTSPAVVHANDYNTMWVGIAAKLLRGSRLVYDAHELWPDQGLPEWRPRLLACEWLFMRLADATITVSPGCAEVMAERYRVPPPVVVRNVPERIVQSPSRPEGLRAGRKPLAVYVGGLDPERGIEQTILALALVPELRLRLMGYGSAEYRSQLDNCATAAGVADRVEYRPPVEPTAVAETIAGADVGLVLIQPKFLSYRMSLPNKLFEYVAAGLPILASDLPVIAAIVHEEGIGEVVPPADVEAIARAMRRLTDVNRNDQLRKQVQAFAQRVNWQTERQTLEQVYTRLLDGHPNG